MPINISEKSASAIPHNIIVKLQAVYDSLKTAEKKAADLLLEDPVFFREASIVDAADRAGCSEATLVRLARKLGYSGYPELKNGLGEGRDGNTMHLYGSINEDDDFNSIAAKVFQASIQALSDTMNVMDKDQYKEAVDALCSAKRMVFCGVGDAATVAQSGYQKFIRIGANVQASADPDVQLITASHLSMEDVLIAISHSGKTRSVLDVVKYAKAQGAKVICITNYPVSPLAKNSDIVLLTAAFTEHMKGEIISKRVAELCIIESLFVNVVIKNKNENYGKINRSNEAVEINKL